MSALMPYSCLRTSGGDAVLWRTRIRSTLSYSVLLILAVGIAGAIGVQTARAQSPGIHIAGATPISPIILTRGCNQIVSDAPNGAQVSGLATLVRPQNGVVSVWRFNNSTKLYQVGYFADASAPLDFTRMGSGTSARSTEAYMLCVNQSVTMLGE